MRNLKKILALALALVMTVSVMSVANAFTDDGSFTAEYTEAAEVLAGLGVYQGYDDGSFQPQSDITRAEVAAVIYRIATGDVDNEQVALYADYNKFDDVTSDKWYAGYVNYCANAEYIKGYNSSTFGPSDSVTGYQVLAMILRVVGYDVNDEFTGPDWQIKVASTAKELGITDTVVTGTLGQAATREVVGELLFRTLVYVPVVKYTIARGYEPVTTITAVDVVAGTTTVTVTGQTLGMKVFGLKQTERQEIDSWGRPGYYWYCNKSSNTRTSLNTVATIEEAPLATYNTAVTPSTLVTDAFGAYSGVTLSAWVNANELTNTFNLYASDNVTSLGAQGRLTEVYADRIVMIDTMLAQVKNVTSVAYNSNGSVASKASMTLKVYDVDTAETYTEVVLTSGSNYTYTAGSMILVNVKTTDDATNGYVNTIYGGHGYATTGSGTGNAYVNPVHKLLGAAESFTGAQTLIYYNKDQHVVNGTTYQDANCFHLDEAGYSVANHIWYLDQYGNLIGATDIATVYSYGTIESIVWTGTGTLSGGYAIADLVLMDGSVLSNVTIAAISDTTDTEPTELTNADTTDAKAAVSWTAGTVSSTAQNNNVQYYGQYLYQIEQLADDSYNLYAVANKKVPYGTASGSRLTSADVTTGVATVDGTNTSNKSTYIVTDSATQYLIQNATTGVFTTVTGFEKVGTYVGATVDYVDVNNDDRADYVFILGEPAAARTSGLFYVGFDAEGNAQKDYNPKTGVWTVSGIFNGQAGTIQVKDPATGSYLKFLTRAADNGKDYSSDTTNVKNYSSAEKFVDYLISNASSNQNIYDVKIVNGYVVEAKAVANNPGETLGDWYDDTYSYGSKYTGLTGARYEASAVYANGVLSIGKNNHFNVIDAVKFVVDGKVSTKTELQGVLTWTGVIHVVYDDQGTKYASEVYIWTDASGSVEENNPTQTTSYTLTFKVEDGSNYTVYEAAGPNIKNNGTVTSTGSTYIFTVQTGKESPVVTLTNTEDDSESNASYSIGVSDKEHGTYTYIITGLDANTTVTISATNS